jgi:hypothetical protein
VLDERAPGGPDFVTDMAELNIGGDFKAILDDRFVLDLTANPDFSQVESDQPQVTVNQRFEVFFPERRPFFMENADYFRTPLTLLFTRRILDPLIGTRFTGRAGGWGVGALLIDDQAPGRIAREGSELDGSRAWFLSGRATRDIGYFSTIGAVYTAREYEGTFNRTGGVDARFRLGTHWTASGMIAGSSTGGGPAPTRNAPAYTTSVSRSDRHVFLSAEYTDIAPDFETRAGFVPRTDIRQLSQFSSYFFLPEDKALVSWGLELYAQAIWDHDGTLLEEEIEPSLEWNFVSNTGFEVNFRYATERLRPQDHAALERTRSYDATIWDIEFRTSLLDWLSVDGNFLFGNQTKPQPGRGRGALHGPLEAPERQPRVSPGHAASDRQRDHMVAVGRPGDRRPDLQRLDPANTLELAVEPRAVAPRDPPV